MKSKLAYLPVMLTLSVMLLLAACGESPAPTAQPATTQASQTTAATSASTTTKATTVAAATTAPATKPTSAAATTASTVSKQAKVNACELFSQGDAEAALGVKVAQLPSKDNAAFYTCFYNTQNDGNTKVNEISYLSVLVYSKDASQSWYATVKKEYEAQSATKALTPVAGLGNDAFSYVVNNGNLNGKGVHLAVLKGKTFFSISVDNTKLEEAQQLAHLKDLAQKIATKL